MIFWAANANKSSNRWHAYDPDRGSTPICGAPFPPAMKTAEVKFPGRHVSCRKCERLVFPEATKAKPKKAKVVEAGACSKLAMVAGGEKKHGTVIDGGRVMRWVGIGWIDVGEATEADRAKFPQVKRRGK